MGRNKNKETLNALLRTMSVFMCNATAEAFSFRVIWVSYQLMGLEEK